jgi:HPt (histidine-containing phosphotransfer) domain-containing protein
MGGAIDDQFFTRLRVMNERFARGVPAVLERLAAARAAFDAAAPDRVLLEEVRAQLHTMAGSASTFGFRVLGQQARALEQRLGVLTAFDAVGEEDWEAWFAGLDAFITWARHDPKAAYYISGLSG